MQVDLPTGTVTLLFTDVEGSTKLLHELGDHSYAQALAGHRRVIREACAHHDGVEVDTQGDAFFFAFEAAPAAFAAAAELTEALSSGPVQVRVGLHTGNPLVSQDGYVGVDVHRAARIAASGHGGQVLVSQSTASLLDGDLRDLGEHRFKDLLAAERVFQLGEAEFPPLKSLYRASLPVASTPFLGREVELAEVAALLVQDDVRLLTLTGPGGAGKTRLSVQAAAEASERFPDGVFWVPLAPLRDPSLLESTFGQALEASEQPGVSLIDSIVAAIGERRMLVVIDNCEHLVEAVAQLVHGLLQVCPRLVIVCSSRERLAVAGERLFSVPPMAAADGEALFVERAQSVASGFVPDEQVAAICEAVDGLPLAIELAAARVRSLSTRSIRERLVERLPLLTSRDRDLDERQRTLEATIAWSYNLLTDDEQRTLCGLAVFAGGCTLEAAEKVAATDLDLLESLLDKSLIRYRLDEAGQDRYWMLETIREYAAARLSESGERDRARSAHRDYFIHGAAELSGDGFMHDGTEVPFLRADRANYRVVLDEALASADAQAALSLVASLGHIWHRAGEVRDGHALIHAALALPGGDDIYRGQALHLAGDMAVDLNDFEEAGSLLDQAEQYATALADRSLLWRVQYTRAYLLGVRGDHEHAADSAQQAIESALSLASKKAETMSRLMHLQNLRAQATDRDDPDLEALEQCLALAEELLEQTTDTLDRASAHAELAIICFGLSRYEEALHHSQTELQLREHSLGSRQAMMGVLLVGLVVGGLGHHATAVKLTAAALSAYDVEGFQLDYEDRRYMARLEADSRAALGDDGYVAAVDQGQTMELQTAIALAIDLQAD